ETRLANAAYRLGLAASRPPARQLVRHGHFTLNGRKLNIPSALVKPGDVIAIKDTARELEVIRAGIETTGQRQIPVWLAWDAGAATARDNSLPNRGDIDTQVTEQLVVEFYAR